MPTFADTQPEVAKAVHEAGGSLVRVGSKPWAHFYGPDAQERAKPVIAVFKEVHGYECRGFLPNGRDVSYDYAIRLD